MATSRKPSPFRSAASAESPCCHTPPPPTRGSRRRRRRATPAACPRRGGSRRRRDHRDRNRRPRAPWDRRSWRTGGPIPTKAGAEVSQVNRRVEGPRPRHRRDHVDRGVAIEVRELEADRGPLEGADRVHRPRSAEVLQREDAGWIRDPNDVDLAIQVEVDRPQERRRRPDVRRALQRHVAEAIVGKDPHHSRRREARGHVDVPVVVEVTQGERLRPEPRWWRPHRWLSPPAARGGSS